MRCLLCACACPAECDRRILADQVSEEVVDLTAYTDTLTKELLWELSQLARGSARQLILAGWKGVSPVRARCHLVEATVLYTLLRGRLASTLDSTCVDFFVLATVWLVPAGASLLISAVWRNTRGPQSGKHQRGHGGAANGVHSVFPPALRDFDRLPWGTLSLRV
jgi:hypothetical protein